MSYDSWLEAPYQRIYGQEPPGWVEDLLGARFFIEEEDAYGVVEDYESWEDADEDGRYGGIDLVVRVEGTNRTLNLSQAELEEFLAGRRTELPREHEPLRLDPELEATLRAGFEPADADDADIPF